MEAPARRDARPSLECPGEPPPSGTGTRTGTREGARRRGNARASRRRRALKGARGGRAPGGASAAPPGGASGPGAGAGGGSCHPAGLAPLRCVPSVRGAEPVHGAPGSGTSPPRCPALIYGLISQGTRLRSSLFVI